MELDFETVEARDKWMAEHADYFTAVRYLGPRLGYERHEAKTLKEVEKIARRMNKSTKRPILIYAVHGVLSAYVKTVK